MAAVEVVGDPALNDQAASGVADQYQFTRGVGAQREIGVELDGDIGLGGHTAGGSQARNLGEV